MYFIVYTVKNRRCYGKKEKLIKRLKEKPKDFTYEEMRTLLGYFGFSEKQSGSGSGVKFINQELNMVINFHKPNPNSQLKTYVLSQVIKNLRRRG